MKLQWHEAVAVVQDVAAQLAFGDTGLVPTASELAIDRGGVLSILSGRIYGSVGSAQKTGDPAWSDYSEAAEAALSVFSDGGSSNRFHTRANSAEQVRGLGLLLQELLEPGSAPDGLRSLAEKAVASPPGFTSVEDFTRALAFFERPGGLVLSSLANRLIPADEESAVEYELENLTRKARVADQPQPSASSAPIIVRMGRRVRTLIVAILSQAPATVRASRRALAVIVSILSPVLKIVRTHRRGLTIIIVAILLVGGLIALATLVPRWTTGPSVSARAVRDTVIARGEQLIKTLKTHAQAILDAPAEPPPETTNVASAERSRIARERRPRPVARTEADVLPAVPIFTRSTVLPGRAEAVRVGRETVAAGGDPEGTAGVGVGHRSGDDSAGRETVFERADDWKPPFFTSEDVEVEPPVLLRPQLPTQSPPGAPADRSGVLEIVVAEDGGVERIRLVASPTERRYYDAMLLAAAKSWRFRPALRNGIPVPYQMRVPLTQ